MALLSQIKLPRRITVNDANPGITVTQSGAGSSITLTGFLDANGNDIRNCTGVASADGVTLYLGSNGNGNWIAQTDNNVGASINRLQMSGGVITSVATWGNITHTGLVLSGPLDVNGQYLDNVVYIEDNSATPAAAGFIRIGHGSNPLVGMNNAGASNRELLSWGVVAVDTLRICGDGDLLVIGASPNLAAGKVYQVNSVQVVGAQQAGIINADGTLVDITTKFNTLLSELETHGLLAVA